MASKNSSYLRLFRAIGVIITVLTTYKILYVQKYNWFDFIFVVTLMVIMICIVCKVSEIEGSQRIRKSKRIRTEIKTDFVEWLTDEWWEHFPTIIDGMKKKCKHMWE